MPLVSHNNLPTFDRLRRTGYSVLTPERAREQDIRELHVGLLNMMPDAALEATERQFFRLIGSSNSISQFHVHPFTLDEIPRSPSAMKHIHDHYASFEKIQEDGLDALIITGANVTEPDLAKEVFWEPLIKAIDWAENNVTSTMCSCLATHAVLQFRYGQPRQNLAEKCWGVYDHQVVDQSHPLVHDINTKMHVPHSRFNEVTREQFEEAGLHVLIAGERPGVQLAVSPDGFRMVFFQGHPEYDQISLLKEYKREVGRFIGGFTERYPPFPFNYFDTRGRAVLTEYQTKVRRAKAIGAAPPVFPEAILLSSLHNTWHDSGEAVIGNWVGWVYQLTNSDRKLQFMDGIDSTNPLDWRPDAVASGV